MADADDAEKPIAVVVDLSFRARRLVANLKQSFGVTQKAGLERGIEFLGSLPPSVLQEVFRQGGDPIAELVKIRLAEMAGAGDTTSIEQAAAIIRHQADRLERLASAYRRELDDLHAGGKSKGVKKSGKTGG